jgi:hypothetical protein
MALTINQNVVNEMRYGFWAAPVCSLLKSMLVNSKTRVEIVWYQCLRFWRFDAFECHRHKRTK